MAVLCGMPTIHLAQRTRLSVHKLFTSCIQQGLVWCMAACDWVMSVLSAMLLIYSFQFKTAFVPRRSAGRYCGVLCLPNIECWNCQKFWGVFLYGVYRPKEWLLIPVVKMET